MNIVYLIFTNTRTWGRGESPAAAAAQAIKAGAKRSDAGIVHVFVGPALTYRDIGVDGMRLQYERNAVVATDSFEVKTLGALLPSK